MADDGAPGGPGLRVVVTGATGNVGSALVARLAADPRVAEVRGLARRLPTGGAPPPKVTYLAVDVAEDHLDDAFAGADVVVHLAWLFQPTHDPTTTWRANVVGSIRVFDAAADAGALAVVHSSSVGAYSPGEGHTVGEEWPTHSTPHAAYGREKAYVERVLDAFEARHPGIRVVRIRPAFVFQRASGTEQRRLFAGPFVPRVLMRRGRLPLLPLPSGLRFQALHGTDVAAAFDAAVTSEARGAFNVAAEDVLDAERLGEVVGARPVTVPRAVARAAVAAGWHGRVVPADPALLDLFLSLPLMRTDRARDVLGWAPTRSGAEALREALDGMAEGAGGGSAPLAPDTVSGRAREVATGVGGSPI